MISQEDSLLGVAGRMSTDRCRARRAITDAAWEVLQGAYDVHVHVSPDVIQRRTDDLDLAKDFLSRGLRGFVLKSHYFPTAERARVVSKAVPGSVVFGGLALNHAVGGINPLAVELAGRSGCKLVWMPTVDAANETAGRPKSASDNSPFWANLQRELAAAGISPAPISVLDSRGKLTKSVIECMQIIKRHDMVLATGHLGRKEIFVLVKSAMSMKLDKVLVTHAGFPSQNLSVQEQTELADMGALIEHCFTTTYTEKAPWARILKAIHEVGAARCLISTDLGQPINPPVSEGFAMFAQRLLDDSFAKSEIRMMAVTNPAKLLS